MRHAFVPLAVVLSAAAAAAFNARTDIPVDAARIDALALKAMSERDVPSVVVGVVHGDELAFAKAYGLANRREKTPATVETLYQAGSITKVFTATLTAILRDEGKLALDDPLAKHLPEGTKIGSIPLAKSGITLRQLATHASGLQRDPSGVDRERPISSKALLASLSDASIFWPPGDRFAYSNLGFMLLGHAIERASGESYPDLLKKRILDPLGMKSTRLAISDADVKGLAAHYWPEDPAPRGERPPWLFGESCAAGGLVSTLPDLAKFVSLELRARTDDAGLPVNPATLRELITPQRLQDSSWQRAIGLGWWILHGDTLGDTVVHGGEVDGQSAMIGFSPEHKVGVVVLANFGSDVAERLAREVFRVAVEPAIAERDAARRLLDAQDYPACRKAAETILARNPEHGWARYALGFSLLRTEPKAAAAEFEKAAKLGYNPAICHYNAGCARALAGERDAAFESLWRARRAGFSDRDQVLADDDLASLRDDPRWKKLLGLD